MNFINFKSKKSSSSIDEVQYVPTKDQIDEERNITALSNDPSNAHLVSNLLRYGVIFASMIVIVGGVRYLISHGTETVDFQTFRGQPSELCSPVGVIKAVYSGDSLALIQFGLLLLIATPVARVAFSLLAFIWQRDLIYVFLTLFVLISLIYGFIGAYV
ncbi:DUF1634 domain-containing protein [Chroococcus sp. FPU101]|uniref:DUF1634 domain-containing protein n=1 Tax=Chroococcus sp. FPU101 TaxID=1974212 RepID=UPI001A8EC85B|nr:DUF1634 domain-containing protein [Chroococcus sp. FPU101]GFE67525.1 hypothetical protein CFPU101_01350 [Chroococcus sp. FPU101]